MKLDICTIISKYKVNQCIALYNSLSEYNDLFTFYVLCMDKDVYNLLKAMEIINIVLIDLSDIEGSRVKKLRKSRKLNEYCWTLKPYFLLYILDNYIIKEAISYIDSDTFFYNSLTEVALNDFYGSIVLTTHKINKKCNGGFVWFRNDKNSRKSLEWWKKNCFQWCYARNKNNGFGDQGYLDDFKKRFNNVQIAEHKGLNVAPWNHFRYDISLKNEEFYIDREKLVFYHFSSIWIDNIEYYKEKFKGKKVWDIYNKYFDEIYKVNMKIKNNNINFKIV